MGRIGGPKPPYKTRKRILGILRQFAKIVPGSAKS
jgi:hypothetical protein